MSEYNGYVIYRDQFTQFRVRGIGKGALPKALLGSFTSEREVKKAIDLYLQHK